MTKHTNKRQAPGRCSWSHRSSLHLKSFVQHPLVGFDQSPLLCRIVLHPLSLSRRRGPSALLKHQTANEDGLLLLPPKPLLFLRVYSLFPLFPLCLYTARKKPGTPSALKPTRHNLPSDCQPLQSASVNDESSRHSRLPTRVQTPNVTAAHSADVGRRTARAGFRNIYYKGRPTRVSKLLKIIIETSHPSRDPQTTASGGARRQAAGRRRAMHSSTAVQQAAARRDKERHQERERGRGRRRDLNQRGQQLNARRKTRELYLYITRLRFFSFRVLVLLL